MFRFILFIFVIADCFNSAYLRLSTPPNEDDYEEDPRKLKIEMQFNPVNPLVGKPSKNSGSAIKNINCEDFPRYALNCTVEAAHLYNSTRKSPPLPSKFVDWCKAIRLMTNCAIDWNSECRDLTDSHFSEESLKGHVHVLNNICDDDSFANRYEEVWPCIEDTIIDWEACYTDFKIEVDEQKNASRPWTHYETHFKLCCARARFRSCTLDVLFRKSKCNQEESVTLQKFSVIVSEGDVYQECDQNVLYENCPGGDPRPPTDILLKLSGGHLGPDESIVIDAAHHTNLNIVFFCYFFGVFFWFYR